MLITPSLHINFYQVKYKLNEAWKRLKYTITLIFNRVMSLLCGRKWWHEIESLKNRKILLGAIPLYRASSNDLTRLKTLKIKAVLSLVERFEFKPGIAARPISPEDWKKAGIKHLNLQTPDFKPLSLATLHQGADFIHENIKKGVYVHCKAGRGRSATAVAAYFIKYHSKTFGKTSDGALAHVKKFRPHIASGQKQKTVLRQFKKSLKIEGREKYRKEDN